MENIKERQEIQEKERERITNRHIAKLFDNLSVLQIPEIALNEIKREFWFLSNDLKDMYLGGWKKENGQRRVD